MAIYNPFLLGSVQSNIVSKSTELTDDTTGMTKLVEFNVTLPELANRLVPVWSEVKIVPRFCEDFTDPISTTEKTMVKASIVIVCTYTNFAGESKHYTREIGETFVTDEITSSEEASFTSTLVVNTLVPASGVVTEESISATNAVNEANRATTHFYSVYVISCQAADSDDDSSDDDSSSD